MSYQGTPPIPTSSWAVADREAHQQTFVTRVYGWMAGGLALSATVAGAVALSPQLTYTIAATPLRWVFLIGLLGLVFWISAGINRMSAATATLLYLVFAALNGATLAAIFYVYTQAAIATAFFVTAGTFAAVATYGATTKRDLTSVGSFMFMGLIGLILASVVNYWFQSPMVYWLTTYFGVFIFVGLTAYDAQKIKRIGMDAALDREGSGRASILGALALYLDFINLFLFMLRIFGGGNRRS
jgi:FtsH-binding integral membrane protein